MIKNPARKALWQMALCLFLAATNALAAPLTIKFRTERAGLVSINVYGPNGRLVRALLSNERLSAGEHSVPWDGKSAPPPTGSGENLPPGDYSWRGIFHEDIGLKLRGWVASGSGLPWRTPDGKEGWGGDAGYPTAVAADDKKVYLGWSLANDGKSVLACTPDARVQWAHRRSEGPSGCKALAVDAGLVYVLGGLEGTGANGGCIYRLDAKDGKPVPWPGGAIDLKISTLWPADSRENPETADAMSVRHGHIYLSFTKSQFLTVLDAKSGDYLQTVVGAAPGMIDVAPTKSGLPDAPDKMVDADFGVVSLGGGVLGRILFAHDPFWVITSDLAPLDRDVNITALTVIGDGAKFHMHTAYVGFGAPYHQVQARPLLDIENTSWVAGQPGGRALLGPWQPDGLHSIRGVALAPDGKLWVAEGDAFPKRFTVWDTNGDQGKLFHEFFGPANTFARDAAINPLDPSLMFAQGCEWRIDLKTGQATCLGIVTREAVDTASYGVGESGHAYLVTARNKDLPTLEVFERLGDGHYSLRTRIFPADKDGVEVSDPAKGSPEQTIVWSDENGDGKMDPDELHPLPAVVRFHPEWTGQDLSLQGESIAKGQASWRFKVSDWTTCGAPRYDGGRTALPKTVGELSADGRFLLVDSGSHHSISGSPIECYELAADRTVWTLPSTSVESLAVGSALLPLPLGNVWLVAESNGQWRLMNADGFELARFWETDAAKIRWPKTAAPDADMTHAFGGSAPGSLTRSVDGKLYLQAGDSAYWNVEVTGLEKVKALPGGKFSLSPPK
jgi:hypothetical protein